MYVIINDEFCAVAERRLKKLISSDLVDSVVCTTSNDQ